MECLVVAASGTCLANPHVFILLAVNHVHRIRMLNLLLSYAFMDISNIPALRAREARLLLSHPRTALVTEPHSRSRSSSITTKRHRLSSFLNTRLRFLQAHRSRVEDYYKVSKNPNKVLRERGPHHRAKTPWEPLETTRRTRGRIEDLKTRKNHNRRDLPD